MAKRIRTAFVPKTKKAIQGLMKKTVKNGRYFFKKMTKKIDNYFSKSIRSVRKTLKRR